MDLPALTGSPVLLAPVADTLRLLDALDRTRVRLEPVIAQVEAALGMTATELTTLRSLAAGSPGADPTALARLHDAGLVDGGRVTEHGRVRLDQADGLMVRVADVVTGVLGPADTAALTVLLSRVAARLPAPAEL
ncbi:hypothetical protein [Pseudonocardia abyssalis]|uniref:MarR family transcriptional regulator n=1 Tax=Pseudonocardia abyssalis TaxID=2792008 RepID=A0ABS6UP27_9PSEU|nr:hypothetical protein [Pseudonocardia abyssalis]MBW0114779.1 hypothetical protein [Pseudonocardia abyssalis]MBW0133977.1 hypothetical protein [Pseudonocardia abyssalis]